MAKIASATYMTGNRSLRLVTAALFVALTCALLSACDWREKEEDEPLYLRRSSATATAVPTETGAPPVQQAVTPTAEVQAPAADEPSMAELIQKSGTGRYSVTYNFTTRGQDGTLTYAQEAPRHVTVGAIAAGTVTFIDDGATKVSCWQLGALGGCSTNPGGSELLDLVLDVQTIGALAVLSPEVTEGQGATIAGRAARCFEWTHKGMPASGCLDAETGLILSFATEADAFTAVARVVSAGVDPALFVPPFPVE